MLTENIVVQMFSRSLLLLLSVSAMDA